MSASFEPQTIPGDDTAIAETVVLPKHLHARPAGQLAQLATRYQGTTIEILASATGKKANARSVLAVMALGAVTGTAITVTATGPDAGAAIAGAVEILLEPED
ncbi:MAG TPA: HPr family phosphocarrier protein [Micromonosporaceae bacterium]|nr:HPr family phosphocarrier protein [Micromonosporaceae bacterium]